MADRVYNSRVPGAVNYIPREVPAASAPVGPLRALPQAGSPLMQQLVKYVQASNPAVVVNEENVGSHLPARFGVRPGSNKVVLGKAGGLVRQLVAAGLLNGPSLSPTDFVSSSPVMRENAVARQRIRMLMGLPPVVPYVDQFAHLNMWQPSVSGGGVSAPPLVPVATLPEPPPPPPAGMLYPPTTPNVLFGSQDPRR